jgi:RNA methyltransferase, TrmH family
MFLSKASIKYVNALKQKKIRQRLGKFTAEGDKIINEILENSNAKLERIFALTEWVEQNPKLAKQYPIEIITEDELKKISSLQTPNQVLAILDMVNPTTDAQEINQSLSLVLDGIQDPGNLGTIIRIADWFGIPYVFCSRGCVDVYNTKVIQASMGSFLRTKVIYTDIEELFLAHPDLPKYGTILGGKSIFQTKLQQKGFIVIGNEGKGITKEVKKLLTHHLEIPSYGQAESLNASVATGIVCAIFRAGFTK